MPSGTRNLSKERRVIFRVASLCFSVTKTVASCHHSKSLSCNGGHDGLSHSKKSPTHHTFIKYETMTKVKDNKGGRPKLADYQKRTKLVRIMFCENDFIYIQSKASKAGLSISEYCHQTAMDNHIRETISPELAKQIRDLSGIANNVNQIAHQMHIDGFDAVKEQCLHIIAAISSIINQVKPMRHDS